MLFPGKALRVARVVAPDAHADAVEAGEAVGGGDPQVALVVQRQRLVVAGRRTWALPTMRKRRISGTRADAALTARHPASTQHAILRMVLPSSIPRPHPRNAAFRPQHPAFIAAVPRIGIAQPARPAMPRRADSPWPCSRPRCRRSPRPRPPYTFDPVHTRVLFAVSHAGFSQALGTVSGSHGELWFDPDDWSSAKLDVVVPLERVDMGDAEMDQGGAGVEPARCRRPPDRELRVQADRAEGRDPCARLRRPHPARRHPRRLHGRGLQPAQAASAAAVPAHRGLPATATLSRKDFGITAWPSVIGDEVQLRIEAEAIRGGRGAGDDAGDDADAAPVPTAPVEPVQPDPASTQTPPEPTP